MRALLLIIVAAGLIYVTLYSVPDFGKTEHPPGVIARHAPLQDAVAMQPWQRGDYTIQPTYSYIIEARVLSKSRYRMDRESDLSPIDLALGWQQMSNTATLDYISTSQRNRWYYLSWRTTPPLTKREIFNQSANVHLIPKDDEVREQILSLDEGDIVRLDGYLVNVRAEDGWYWNTSTSRADRGDGSCELLWVEMVRVME